MKGTSPATAKPESHRALRDVERIVEQPHIRVTANRGAHVTRQLHVPGMRAMASGLPGMSMPRMAGSAGRETSIARQGDGNSASKPLYPEQRSERRFGFWANLTKKI